MYNNYKPRIYALRGTPQPPQTPTFPRCYNLGVWGGCGCGAVERIIEKEQRRIEIRKIDEKRIRNKLKLRVGEVEAVNPKVDGLEHISVYLPIHLQMYTAGAVFYTGVVTFESRYALKEQRRRPEESTIQLPLTTPTIALSSERQEEKSLPRWLSPRVSDKKTKKRNKVITIKKYGQQQRIKAGTKTMITERDIKIMAEINRHGFMGAEEVSRVFTMPVRVAYTRLQKLVEAGLVKHERILHAYPGVYWLTFSGKGACNSSLSTMSAPSAGTFEHELKTVRLYLALKAKYGDKLISWQTARELRSNKFNISGDPEDGFKAAKSHTPDALLVFDGVPSLLKYALELELSIKSTPRLKGIIENYTAALHRGQLDRVVYYCGNDTIKKRMEDMLKTSPMAAKFQVITVKDETDGLPK